VKRPRKLWLLALAPAALALVASLGVLSRGRAERAVTVAGPLHERVIARGVVMPTGGIAEVRSLASGRVVRVLVREGERVEAGQLLAELDEGPLSAEVARREAEGRALAADAQAIAEGARPAERQALEGEVAAARADWEAAQQRADRDAALLASSAVSDQQARDSRRAEQVAKAQLDAALARARAARVARPASLEAARHRLAATQASVEAARRTLDRTRLLSPIAGVVLVRRADPGDTVREEAAQPLFEIADPSQLEIRAEIDEAHASKVAASMPVTVLLPGGREPIGRGRLGRVSARLERRTIDADDVRVRADGLVRAAWVEWDGPPLDLPIGQRVEVHVGLPSRQVATLVPRRAVRVRDGKAVVAVPAGLWTSERAVELGAADDDSVEVRGLADGTTVLLTEK
jgi:multidrug efflux pump subunit AcrA (membrane-fusion protein)